MKEQILNHLASTPPTDSILWFDSLDSTNTPAKLLAALVAPNVPLLIPIH